MVCLSFCWLAKQRSQVYTSQRPWLSRPGIYYPTIDISEDRRWVTDVQVMNLNFIADNGVRRTEDPSPEWILCGLWWTSCVSKWTNAQSKCPNILTAWCIIQAKTISVGLFQMLCHPTEWPFMSLFQFLLASVFRQRCLVTVCFEIVSSLNIYPKVLGFSELHFFIIIQTTSFLYTLCKVFIRFLCM